MPKIIPFWRNKKVTKAPLDVPVDIAKTLNNPASKQDVRRELIRTGSLLSKSDMVRVISDALAISYYRRSFYVECMDAMEHPFVSGAVELYIDSVCGYNTMHNASVWVTSEDGRVENIGNQFLSEINIEERVRDWAGQLASMGDLFLEAIGREGIGVAFVDDNVHPADMERVDVNGRLEGFVRTNLQQQTGTQMQLEAPWKYVHMRTFGVQRRVLNTTLGIFGDPGRRYTLDMTRYGNRPYRLTTRYGVPLIAPALPIYKRLKLSEDSVMLARMTRGIVWYLYKVKISGGNLDQASQLVRDYAELLKRKTGLDVTQGQEYWKDKWSALYAQVEDLFVPETDDMTLTHEQMGVDPNIKAIVDVEMLESRLLGSLRVSRSMLGLTDELPGGIGQSSANRISINFAKNAQRLQNALRQGVARLLQIHLAYLGENPDPTRFDIQLAEISTAEEEEIKDALDKGVDIADKLIDMLIKTCGDSNIDRLETLDYINQKILKLNDLDLEKIVLKAGGANNAAFMESVKRIKALHEAKKPKRFYLGGSDLYTYLPSQHTATQENEGKVHQLIRITETKDAKVENAKLWTPMTVTFVKEEDNEGAR